MPLAFTATLSSAVTPVFAEVRMVSPFFVSELSVKVYFTSSTCSTRSLPLACTAPVVATVAALAFAVVVVYVCASVLVPV